MIGCDGKVRTGIMAFGRFFFFFFFPFFPFWFFTAAGRDVPSVGITSNALVFLEFRTRSGFAPIAAKDRTYRNRLQKDVRRTWSLHLLKRGVSPIWAISYYWVVE